MPNISIILFLIKRCRHKDQIIKFKQAQTSAVKSSSPSRKQKKTSTESTISPETQKIDENSLDATIIAGEEKTVIGGEEKTVIGGEEKATKTATQSNTTKTTATISPNTTTSSKEDEGFLFILLWNGERRGSDLVILDAKDLIELAVYELPISIPHGLHGSWVD